jgi:Flp pilus assembly protein TadB
VIGWLVALAMRPGDARLVQRATRLAPKSPLLRLLAGGRLAPGTERSLAGLRVVLALAGGGVVAVAGGAAVGPPALVLAVLWGAGTAALPALVLRQAIRVGADTAVRHLPLALEMIAAGLQAGLPGDRALAVGAGAAPPPLDGMLRRAAAASASGMLASAALAAEAEVTEIAMLGAVAALMERRQRLGLPLAPHLLAVSEVTRARSRAETLARAARRGPLAALLTAILVAPACACALLIMVLSGVLTEAGGLGLG